ncbi:TetR/AcrR family transcriptional regulator [Micromonospora sp. NPDC050417]|uniref:TetR/AcrR family transcriptional regulator n=1 Tax=Micromonospora sp. NPDC050417 TaxID=3364280 RepID=UPI003797F4E6
MPAKVTGSTSPRERLLMAADELFYAEGVHSVGIDRVIEHAGVAKATLYNAYGSKDELVRAYLSRRQEARQARVARKLEGLHSPRERLLAIFDALGDAIAQPDFRGCAFVNASAELAPGSRAGEVCDSSRAWLRTLFRDLAREAGATDPDHLARQFVLLYDGASVAALTDHDLAAAGAARDVAATLVDAATGR